MGILGGIIVFTLYRGQNNHTNMIITLQLAALNQGRAAVAVNQAKTSRRLKKRSSSSLGIASRPEPR